MSCISIVCYPRVISSSQNGKGIFNSSILSSVMSFFNATKGMIKFSLVLLCQTISRWWRIIWNTTLSLGMFMMVMRRLNIFSLVFFVHWWYRICWTNSEGLRKCFKGHRKKEVWIIMRGTIYLVSIIMKQVGKVMRTVTSSFNQAKGRKERRYVYLARNVSGV